MRRPRRDGFSLMEMIIATAILAGSGAALFALIGQASQFARRAEERTVALQIAETVLDESLAMDSENSVESEGTLESDPRWSYRIDRTEVAAVDPSSPHLSRIIVSVFRGSGQGTPTGASGDAAVVRLVRWTPGPLRESAP